MSLPRLLAILILTLCGYGCKPPAAPSSTAASTKPISLTEARRGFTTHLVRQERTDEPAPPPPEKIFRLVRYPSSVGELPAYVGTAPADGGRHPAIIWLVGGFSNSIGEVAWMAGPPENDQSASAFREAGIVMMYPALRGGNDHPGFKEAFFGEVDDVLAAADYLRKLDYVDPARIYLGGHSTGGTLALLAVESTQLFRAVFSFGPAADVANYGSDVLPFDTADRRELKLRAPANFLTSIRTPTFVFEGTRGRSNIDSLRAMAELPHADAVQFHPVRGADHFSGLVPMTRLIARKILTDEGTVSNIAFSTKELAPTFATPSVQR